MNNVPIYDIKTDVEKMLTSIKAEGKSTNFANALQFLIDRVIKQPDVIANRKIIVIIT